MYRAIRQTYGSLLMNGPFTVIIARNGEMIGLGDRIRLRPLVAGIVMPEDSPGYRLYISSELAPIHLVEPNIKHTWTPLGGEPVVGRLGESSPSCVPRRVPAITATAEDDRQKSGRRGAPEPQVVGEEQNYV